MAQNCSIKGRPLSKDDVICLLDLIDKHEVITSKKTDATNNRMKEEAWKSLAYEFSEIAGEIRRPEQLRLKWENLKKAARKRNAMIRQNKFKTRGGKMYIPPDEALDRVASMLDDTCVIVDVKTECTSRDDDTVEVESENDAIKTDCKNFTAKRIVFNTPNNSLNKRRRLSDLHKAQLSKELAMASYFQAKTEKIRLENLKLELEIQQLQNSAANSN
ncbi:unnamed protein product [Leptidea sinapis]|uniref:Regulatory protein zeste n=1 Tax=Leptidea sinapis TaxID=189913 RepID=A0A5E4PXP7_9NEOP|nr:unnamed protein product [Leptidea sinapis]